MSFKKYLQFNSKKKKILKSRNTDHRQYSRYCPHHGRRRHVRLQMDGSVEKAEVVEVEGKVVEVEAGAMLV